MGIRHLQTFQQRNVPGGYYQVDILKEIDRHKRIDPHPTIVIDVMSFMSIHNHDKLMAIFGAGRFSVFAEMYHSIFQRLEAAGAQLAFFIDGPHQTDKNAVWLTRQNDKYKNGCAILDLMASRTPARLLVANTKIHNVNVFLTEFPNLCQQYGKLRMSFLNECDLEIVEYANRVKALAVVTDDSDFLIYPGEFRYWSTISINVQKLTTMEYDRKALRRRLMLTNDQMKIFATFGGNDIVTYDEVQKFQKDLGRPYEKFLNLASYIRRNFQGPIDDYTIRNMSLAIFKTNVLEKLTQVKKSLQSYEISIVGSHNVTDELLIYAMDQGHASMYQILTGGPIDLLMHLEDLRIDKPFAEITAPLFGKMCGILLQHKKDPNLKQLLYKKLSHDEPYVQTALDPVYPDQQLPDLLDLYRAADMETDKFIDLKMSLLAWMVGVDKTVVAAIPPKYLISLLTIVYLLEQQQLTTHQADMILIIVHESITGAIPKILPLPEFCDAVLVKKSFLYVKLWYWVACGLLAVGLNKVPKNIHWDGVYFHHLALETNEQIDDRLKDILHLRVYDTKQATK